MGADTIDNYKSIQLDGVKYNKAELESFCEECINDQGTSDWLKDVYQFILDWISSDEFITAQTSGSTGIPKQIKLKKKYMVASAQKTIDFFNLKPKQTALLCLSANYIAGKMMIVRAFVGGFNLLLSEPESNPLSKIHNSIDFAAMVPMQVANSIDILQKDDLIKTIIIGGGAVSIELKNKLKKYPSSFFETYGMTETVSHVAIRKIGQEDFFKPMSGVSFSKDDRNCLVINAMDIGCENLVTNDIVQINDDGSFLYCGRFDHVINSGGIKISPEKLEQKLGRIIKAKFVISAVPDEKLGEKIVLVIEKGANIEKINKCLNSLTTLSKFERPKQIIQIKEFPLTKTQKIKRIELKNSIIKFK